MRLRHTTLAIALVAAACGAGCAAHSPEPPATNAAEKSGDWSQFQSGRSQIDPKNARVTETPIEITGVPYVRAVRLSWSTADVVPSYEPGNETLKLPGDARQAVLVVVLNQIPKDVDVRVDWFYGDGLVFNDSLESRDDGDHYFALIKREGRALEPLPKGGYRALVYAGDKLIKTVRFEVLG